jgi:hypothetical protein
MPSGIEIRYFCVSQYTAISKLLSGMPDKIHKIFLLWLPVADLEDTAASFLHILGVMFIMF